MYMLLVNQSPLPLTGKLHNFRRLRAAGVSLFNPAYWTCSACCRPAKRFVAGEPICKPTPKAAQALAIPLPSPLLRHITARQIGAEHGNATQFTQNEDFKLGHTQKTFKLFCLALLYTYFHLYKIRLLNKTCLSSSCLVMKPNSLD
ncbi:unnamed protein product [Clavelina lepadiformis]|uniref:Uncharacterized protein n=1 Tax=Clavelina lepadiformis TaxID=159417 RepID=A0ABP0G218_CLALP